MPTYLVKPEKRGSPIGAIEKDKDYYPSVHVDVSSEIIRALDVGQDATVTLHGKIVSLSENRGSRDSRSSLQLELRKVEAYPSKQAKADATEKAPKKEYS